MSENIEYWDAYYPDGTHAGVDLIRGREIPGPYRHAVAEVFVLHEDGTVLLMKRDLNKPNSPGCWESGAGGSVLKGETFEQGARRELQEETGIRADNLRENYHVVTHDSIYQGYVCITDVAKNSVTLQEGETIEYQWISKEEFLRIFDSDTFVNSLRGRLRKSAAPEMEWLKEDKRERYFGTKI